MELYDFFTNLLSFATGLLFAFLFDSIFFGPLRRKRYARQSLLTLSRYLHDYLDVVREQQRLLSLLKNTLIESHPKQWNLTNYNNINELISKNYSELTPHQKEIAAMIRVESDDVFAKINFRLREWISDNKFNKIFSSERLKREEVHNFVNNVEQLDAYLENWLLNYDSFKQNPKYIIVGADEKANKYHQETSESLDKILKLYR
jgi:hypothetical protein